MTMQKSDVPKSIDLFTNMRFISLVFWQFVYHLSNVLKTDSRAKIQRSKHFFELWTPLMIAFNFVARRGIQSTFLTFYDFVLCYKQASSAGWVLFWHWYWYICSKTRSIAYTFLQKIQHKFEINTSARNGIVRSSTEKRCATSKCISFFLHQFLWRLVNVPNACNCKTTWNRFESIEKHYST